jgi:hypothetical protein
MKVPLSKIGHVDLVVSSIARSLPFYRGLLEPNSWNDLYQAAGHSADTRTARDAVVLSDGHGRRSTSTRQAL